MGRPRKQPGLGLPKRVYLRSGTFYYVHHDGRWENLGKDFASAKKLADTYNTQSPLVGTLSYWFGQWRQELDAKVKAAKLAPRTRDDYADAIEKLSAFFGRMDPGSVKPHHVGEYLDIGLQAGRAVRANREKAALSSCYTWLVRNGVVDSNPCSGVKRNSESKRDRWISDDEFHAVYEIAGPAVRAWMVLIYRTLQRPSDILSWTRKNIVVREGRKLLEFRQSKTGKQMSIVVNDQIQTELGMVASARQVGAMPLIPTETGQHYTEMGLASMFRRHVVAAGIEDFAPYDLKAKGATDMYLTGVSLETISALCGHESTKTTEVYIKAHQRVAVEANARELTARSKRPLSAR